MGKTVATITYHRSDNFGSVLQCYALAEKLRQMGYNQFVIDYRKKEVANHYRIFKKPTNKYLLLTDCYHILHYPALKQRQQRFEQFRADYLRKSQIYSTKSELFSRPPVADAYITGSDQVWNTEIFDFDESYLLDFVKCGRKIAYAASGVAALSEKSKSYLQESIVDFDAVSLRENKAASALNVGKIVIDPVLLLKKQDWEQLCVNLGQKKKYMLCYFAGGVSRDFESFTRKKAKAMGLERIVLSPEWRNLFRKATYAYDAGPKEFVSLIQQAELVCTNSFHGTAFSILLNKPFIVGQHVPFSDDRISTLLSYCNLSSQEISPACPPPSINNFIDYAPINDLLAKARSRDEAWLRAAIEGE